MPTFSRQTELPVSVSEAFAWHARPGALDRLLPPWQKVRILQRGTGITDGSRVVLEMKLGPLKKQWVALHRDYLENQQFRDVQERGPFAAWEHTHRFSASPAGQCLLTDQVDYRLPGGPLGGVLGGHVRRQLDAMFRWRHQRTGHDLQRHAAFADRPRLQVAISGSTGLVGTQLAAFLSTGGHTVLPMVRRSPTSGQIGWEPATGQLTGLPEQLDAVVHLAGVSVAGRWTEAHKRAIADSRVEPTERLCRTLAALPRKPKVLIAASAIGFYGDRGDEELTEESLRGKGFLPDVCQAWEAVTKVAEDAGIRVIRLRIGIVLAAQGGALAKMLPPFRMGVGGKVGSGRQYLSWISLDDLVGLIHFGLMSDRLAGAVNATAPQPETNAAFTRTLGRVLHRPTLFPVPAAAVRMLFGEMGETLLLQGAKVLPQRALEAGFPFLHPTLEAALRAEQGLLS